MGRGCKRDLASDGSGLSLAKGYLAREHGAWAPTPSTLKGRAGDAGHCVCVVLARRSQPGCSPKAALPAPQSVSWESVQTSRAQILVNSTESFSDIKVNDLSGGKWPLSLEKAANHGRVKTLGPSREPVSVKVLQALLFVSLSPTVFFLLSAYPCCILKCQRGRSGPKAQQCRHSLSRTRFWCEVFWSIN